jgi:hypothetical protein
VFSVFSPSRAFGNLRPFVFSDHSLERQAKADLPALLQPGDFRKINSTPQRDNSSVSKTLGRHAREGLRQVGLRESGRPAHWKQRRSCCQEGAEEPSEQEPQRS